MLPCETVGALRPGWLVVRVHRGGRWVFLRVPTPAAR